MNDNSCANKLFNFNHKEEKKPHDNNSSQQLQSLDSNDFSFTTLNSINNIHEKIIQIFYSNIHHIQIIFLSILVK